MLKYFRQTLDFLLFSNLFIALCAVAQGMVTYQLLKVKPDYYVLRLLFFSTLALYNFSILLAKPKHPEKSPFRRVRWIFSHYRIMISLTLIAVLSCLILVTFLSLQAQILLAFLGLISIAYSLPIFTFQDKKFGIRNIPGLKLFLIALVWSVSCVLLPILELESSQAFTTPARDTLLLIAKRFLFVAAITVPFDIRDLFQDRNSSLKTIPVMVGEKNAYLVCQALLMAYLVLLFLFTSSFDRNFFGLMLTIILTGWLIFKSSWKRDEYYYFLYLDVTMIVQFLMLLACNWLPL
ncbi:MAG: hypothetical protein JWQ25_862 [Daejeonella sp.]|nr:hypothetical protein [Daejeonella sp.]